MDEMDQVDLISDVYTKGETLMQTVSDPMKTKVENQLAQFENEWAEFCGSVTECSKKIEHQGKRQEGETEELCEDFKEIATELRHFENLLNEMAPNLNSMENVSEKLQEIQV